MTNQIFVLKPTDMLEDIETEFYVMEKFPNPCFVTDENGEIKCMPLMPKQRQRQMIASKVLY